jgi:hypothetical protein
VFNRCGLLGNQSLFFPTKPTSELSCAVVLYGFETWSQTLREESRLRAFENRTEERWGDGRVEELHNEELRDFYSSPSIIRIIRPRRMR